MQSQLFTGARIKTDDGSEAVFVGGIMTNDEKTLILVEDCNRRRQWIKFTTALEVIDPSTIESASADRTTEDKIKSFFLRKLTRD